MSVTARTFCRACNKACPVIAEIDDGRLVGVTGDHDDELYEGYTCVKGRRAPDFANHPDRLLHSLARTADGTFTPIAVETAMDEIAAKLSAIVEAHGPRSVAVYTGTQLICVPAGELLRSFLAEIGSPMRFEAFSIDKPGRAIAWTMLGKWQAPHQGFHEPDVALMLGINPFVNGIGGLPLGHPSRWLATRMANGMRLIVIDPRRTDIAKRATLHLAPRPGFDSHIVAAMIRTVIAEGLWDRQFVDGNVRSFDALRAAVEPFDPHAVARAAGVPVGAVIDAARLFATAGRGFAVAGTGPHMSASGTLLEYMVLALDTVCGHWMRAGETVANPGVLIAPRTFCAQADDPTPAYGNGPMTRVRGLGASAAGMPTSTLAEEILTPGPGKVRALVSIGGNPVAAFPDQLLTLDAMRSLELLVQVDPWMSQTARLAHYVIAPRQWMEMAGTTQKLEKVPRVYAVGYAFPDNYAHVAPPVVEPPPGAEVIEDWELVYGVARRMGLQLSVATQLGAAMPIDMTNAPTTEELIEVICTGSRIPYETVRDHPGGGVFAADQPVVVAAKQPGWTGRLDVGNDDMLHDLQHLWEATDDEPDDSYPFRVLCRRMMHVVNSTFNDASTNRGRGYNPAFMHPADLHDLGLRSGDLVTLTSARASIPAVVEPDRDVLPGTISMAFGFGLEPEHDDQVRAVGSSAARLIGVDADFERYSGQPRMSNIPVRITQEST